jgi:hypothetical protein
VDYILFFEKTTNFKEKLNLGFKPHFSWGVHPEIYSQPFTNTLYKNDKDTTNIATVISSQMDVGFSILNSQLYGFNNSSTGKICVTKREAQNGQIIIMQGIYKWLSGAASYENVANQRVEHHQGRISAILRCRDFEVFCLLSSVKRETSLTNY